MKFFLFLLFSAFFSSSSFAVTWTPNTDFLWAVQSGKITTFPGAGTGQVLADIKWETKAAGPVLSKSRTLGLAGNPTATFRSFFTPGSIAKGLTSPVSALVTLAAVPLLSKLVDEACVRIGGTISQPAPGTFEECKYKDQNVVTWTDNNDSRYTGSSPEEAFKAFSSANSVTIMSYGQQVTTSYSSPTCTPPSSRSSTCTSLKNHTGDSPVTISRSFTSTTVVTKVKDGYQPSTASAVELLIKPRLDAWSQTDFFYGRDGATADSTQIVNEGLKNGVSFDTDNVEVTGPATSPGESTSTTSNNSSGEPVTTKTTTTNNYSYVKTGPTTYTISNNISSVTTNSNTTTGSTVTVSTSTKSDTPPDYGTANDTVLPNQPKLYTPKYPNGLVDVWANKKAEMMASPLSRLVGSLMPSVVSGGACPSWMLSLNFGFKDFGSHDVAPPCWVWDFGKIIVILSALLLARALIFGG